MNDFSMQRCNVEKTVLGSPYFPTNPLAPRLKALSGVSLSSVIVKMMKGISLFSFRSIFRNSKPFVTGIWISHTITSVFVLFIFSRASSTENADSISMGPCMHRHCFALFKNSASSSTKRTLISSFLVEVGI